MGRFRVLIQLLFPTIGWIIVTSTFGLASHAQNLVDQPSGQATIRDKGDSSTTDCDRPSLGSPYIPVDNWVYPAVLRLYSMGFVDHIYLGMRPWTRQTVIEILPDIEDKIEESTSDSDANQAREIYKALKHELELDISNPCGLRPNRIRLESTYFTLRGVSGTPLRDSFHLGSTVINDYGRPYEGGMNAYTGLSGYVTAGRFTLYARGEFRRSPSAAGYSSTLANALSVIDLTYYVNPTTNQTKYFYPQTTIPMGPLPSIANGRLLEAYVSANVLNHQISLGKVDQWLGPAQGGSFAYSNNAENIYGFEINRVEPFYVPYLSAVTGPFRYEFVVGALRGHEFIPNPDFEANPSPDTPNVISPGNPWVHLEKISFRPTINLEFGFERTAIWGGKGHGPITLHTFLNSFFSATAPGGPGSTGPNEKFGRNDPGARFGSFDFSYRLPFLRRQVTLYADGEVHDDVSPIDAPRRASWRPGLYLSHVPGIPRMDIRFEAATTCPDIDYTGHGGPGPGRFMYWEGIQKQGYTNNGQIFGDWIGRADKGGQAWITYHLSGNEWIQVSARNQKADADFISTTTTRYGTTLNDLSVQVVKRLGPDLELNGSFTLERYKAPIYLPGMQKVTTTNIQLTWYPGRKVEF
jgi:hypothetical protein